MRQILTPKLKTKLEKIQKNRGLRPLFTPPDLTTDQDHGQQPYCYND